MTEFHAEIGVGEHQNLLTISFIQQGEKPVKLGDGSYGCVFQVRGGDKRNYALKIFYESEEELIKKSQKEEMSIGYELREHFRNSESELGSLDRYLVLSQGRVSEFRQKEAYKKLKDYFDESSFRISNDAIIMNYYPMSLKDLLERGWPTSQSTESDGPYEPEEAGDVVGRGQGGTFGAVSGYEILRNLSGKERERTIWPFARDIAKALSLLHEAGFNHQDIKPANILIRRVGNSIEAALADLGFINAGRTQAHGSNYQSLPLGTRHYRSPEQTSSYDICEVDIRKLRGRYELITTDPKFRQTFSEMGDLVVFAKLEGNTQWEILNIEHESDEKSTDKRTVISIKELHGVPLQNDVRTQITIHKRQTARTDLFGLGAIMYDMLTCGRSPEQFYDLLRAHDREDSEGIERGLAQRYQHYKNGGGTVPEIDAIFKNLKIDSNSEFPSFEMVRIILKCMMSRACDSYYNEGKWVKAEEDLEKLASELASHQHQEIGTNPLTRGRAEFSQEIDPPVTSPLDNLFEIQRISYGTAKDSIERIVKGYRFLNKIFEMLTKEIEEGGREGEDFSFLSDVSPRSLKEQRGYLVPQFPLFQKKSGLGGCSYVAKSGGSETGFHGWQFQASLYRGSC